MRARLLFVAILFLLLAPCFGGDGPPEEPALKTPDIPPRKGVISKNIHVLFDCSASMTSEDLARGYGELQLLATQGADEFNLAVTAFGVAHLRMPVKDPDCKLKPNWMAMPSADNYKLMMSWLKSVKVGSWNTRIDTALKAIFKENKEHVSIIVISDVEIADLDGTIALIKAARKEKGHHPVTIGFVNVSAAMNPDIYRTIKKNGFWYINVAPKEEPEPEEEDDWDD